MTTTGKRRLAGVIGLIVGLLSFVFGSRVLAGFKQPEYVVLNWLVIYNTFMGLVSFAAGLSIWLRQNRAATIAVIISAIHIGVLISLILIFASGGSVAWESLSAMAFRVMIWIGIAIIVLKAQVKTNLMNG